MFQFGKHSGYGFVDFEDNERGLSAALHTIDTVKNMKIGNVVYDCRQSDNLRRYLSEVDNLPLRQMKLQRRHTGIETDPYQWSGPLASDGVLEHMKVHDPLQCSQQRSPSLPSAAPFKQGGHGLIKEGAALHLYPPAHPHQQAHRQAHLRGSADMRRAEQALSPPSLGVHHPTVAADPFERSQVIPAPISGHGHGHGHNGFGACQDPVRQRSSSLHIVPTAEDTFSDPMQDLRQQFHPAPQQRHRHHDHHHQTASSSVPAAAAAAAVADNRTAMIQSRFEPNSRPEAVVGLLPLGAESERLLHEGTLPNDRDDAAFGEVATDEDTKHNYFELQSLIDSLVISTVSSPGELEDNGKSLLNTSHSSEISGDTARNAQQRAMPAGSSASALSNSRMSIWSTPSSTSQEGSSSFDI